VPSLWSLVGVPDRGCTILEGGGVGQVQPRICAMPLEPDKVGQVRGGGSDLCHNSVIQWTFLMGSDKSHL
jgi:hypothetical protein